MGLDECQPSGNPSQVPEIEASCLMEEQDQDLSSSIGSSDITCISAFYANTSHNTTKQPDLSKGIMMYESEETTEWSRLQHDDDDEDDGIMMMMMMMMMFPGSAFSLSEVNAHCPALEEKVHPTADSSCLAVLCQDLESQDKEKKGTTSRFSFCLVFREDEGAQGNLGEDGVAVECQIQSGFDGSLEHSSLAVCLPLQSAAVMQCNTGTIVPLICGIKLFENFK
ncbi:hypothetical protein DUI87_14010 [Hirundo rustica rustica]|uniref:Uncharacterized protein n=1 Tax=Hirundo rustica rustica TaxID=333673 RepID=A0A3M0K8Z5_HIRRU|nr:hypothetical protein DUI87_14010 [Hirundo rustica rustica]